MKARFIITLTAVLFFFAPLSASAVSVDLELLLLADVSGSINDTDFALQRDGYANAFRSSAVQDAILGESGTGKIAVSLVYWAFGRSVAVPWTLIENNQDSDDFADAIATAARPSNIGLSTFMTEALQYGKGLFADNGYESNRLTIDLSGDGYDSTCGTTLNCVALQNERDSFLTGGNEVRVINALWIQDRSFFGVNLGDQVNAIDYGNANVIGGPNSFQSVVANFTDFGAALTSKLVREISGGNGEKVPEPGTLLLLSSGLAGLALYRRRMNKA